MVFRWEGGKVKGLILGILRDRRWILLFSVTKPHPEMELGPGIRGHCSWAYRRVNHTRMPTPHTFPRVNLWQPCPKQWHHSELDTEMTLASIRTGFSQTSPGPLHPRTSDTSLGSKRQGPLQIIAPGHLQGSLCGTCSFPELRGGRPFPACI